MSAAVPEALRLLAEHLDDGVALLDGSGTLLYLNQPLAALLRTAPATAVGRHLGDFLPDLDLLNRGYNAVATLRADSVEAQLGEERSEYRVTFVPYADGDDHRLLLLLHDVSEARRTERVQKTFIENVSHELRTPLTSMLGFIETLRDGAIDEPENARRFLGIIGDHTQRLVKLVNAQIDLLKLERGMVQFRFAPLRLADLAASVAALFAPLLREHDLHWSTAIPDGFELVADRDRLEQVLINLVDNAVKFTPAGGHISLQAERLGQHALLTVADTGCGIPEEERTLVLRKFYKASVKPPRPARGFGLGLSITSEIIRAHRGAILIESAPGEGTRVKLSLPLLPAGGEGPS